MQFIPFNDNSGFKVHFVFSCSTSKGYDILQSNVVSILFNPVLTDNMLCKCIVKPRNFSFINFDGGKITVT